MEQAAADGPLAQTRVQDGLWAQSAATPAHPHLFWQREGQEEAVPAVCRGRGGDVQVFSLQRDGEGSVTEQ